MNVGLEKLVQDIKNETTIWPIENSKNTAEEDAAWDRVGARNKMSGIKKLRGLFFSRVKSLTGIIVNDINTIHNIYR